MKHYHKVLAIAGSDSGGGAGIQADIKAISACGCYASTAITAITAQNTLGVTDIHPVPINNLKQQIRAVLEDIGADSVKIGMLHSSETIQAVKELITEFSISNMVLDPVMVSTSGSCLLEAEAVKTLTEDLIPLAKVITPNVPEAEILLNHTIESQSSLLDYASQLGEKYGVSVLLKAGHLEDDDLIDVFYNVENKEIIKLKSKRVYTPNTHGTGCSLSSALAAYIAKGLSLNEAVKWAKDYINQAIICGKDYQIGSGHGPVHHFYNLWKP